MPRKKKRFINKNDPNTLNFQVVHRSQRDPLQADEDAPKRVLLPIATGNAKGKREKEQKAHQLLEELEDSSVVAAAFEDAPEDKSKGADEFGKKAELAQYGIYYDDNYNYLQHMKPRSADADVIPADEKTIIKILEEKGLEPSEVLGSKQEEAVGLLNLAAPVSGPRLDWDPEIVAALDDGLDLEDPENQIQDDFIFEAEADSDGEFDSDDSEDSNDDDDNESVDSFDSNAPFTSKFRNFGIDRAGFPDDDEDFPEEETKSRFTEYSMSSSILPRNKGLQLHDERFEKLYEQYDDDRIGALDEDDDIEGIQDLSVLDGIMDEFLAAEEDKRGPYFVKETTHIYTKKSKGSGEDDDEEDEEKEEDGDKTVKEMMTKVLYDKRDREWDCQSILSTRSTLYNHPKLISEPARATIKLDKKTGLPVGVFEGEGKRGKQDSSSEEEEEELEPVVDTSKPRNRAETAEEKRQRKIAVKEQRRARRAAKKSNKGAFKAEEIRQVKVDQNAKAMRGVKLNL